MAGAEPTAAYLNPAAQGSEPLRLLRQRTLVKEGHWIHQAFRQRQRETSRGFTAVLSYLPQFPHEESKGLGCTDKDRQTLSLVLITGKGEKCYILLPSKGAQH